MKRINIKSLQYKRERRIQDELVDIIKTYEDAGEVFNYMDVMRIDMDANLGKQRVLDKMVKDNLIIATSGDEGEFDSYSINYNYFI